MKGLSIVTAAVIVGSTSISFAADWNLSIDANLMLTESAYSNNWDGEETGAASWTFNCNSLAERQLHSKVHNKNTLKLSFGQNHHQDRETGSWSKPVKSTDLIDFESVFRFTLGTSLDPFAAGRVESQFLDASDPGANRYINPVRLAESFGIARVLMKGENREWTARLGGVVRQYFDREGAEPFTGEQETRTSNDGGLEFVTEVKTPLAEEWITLTSKLILFRALFYSEADRLKGLPSENYWKSPDVNWESIFTASITKYLMVNLYVQLLYDKEIDPGARFKQTLSLGLTYKVI